MMLTSKELDKQYSDYRNMGRQAESFRAAAKSYGEDPATQQYAEDACRKADQIETQRKELLFSMVEDFGLVEGAAMFTVLRLKYIMGMTWDEMESEMGYTPRHLRRLWHAALKEINEKKLSQNVRK